MSVSEPARAPANKDEHIRQLVAVNGRQQVRIRQLEEENQNLRAANARLKQRRPA